MSDNADLDDFLLQGLLRISTSSTNKKKNGVPTTSSSDEKEALPEKRPHPVTESDFGKRTNSNISSSSNSSQRQSQQPISGSNSQEHKNHHPKSQLLFSNCTVTFAGRIISSSSSSNQPPIFIVLPYGKSIGKKNQQLFERLLSEKGGAVKSITDNIGVRNQQEELRDTILSKERIFSATGGGLVIVCGFSTVQELEEYCENHLSGGERKAIDSLISVAFVSPQEKKVACVKKEWITACIKEKKIVENLLSSSSFESLIRRSVVATSSNSILSQDEPPPSLPLFASCNSNISFGNMMTTLNTQDFSSSSSFTDDNSQQQKEILEESNDTAAMKVVPFGGIFDPEILQELHAPNASSSSPSKQQTVNFLTKKELFGEMNEQNGRNEEENEKQKDDSGDFDDDDMIGHDDFEPEPNQQQGKQSSNSPNIKSRTAIPIIHNNNNMSNSSSSSSSSNTKNPAGINQLIIDGLRQLATFHRASNLDPNDQHRARMYQKAATQLENFPAEIRSSEQVRHLPSVGMKIGQKIDEILQTGTSRKLEAMKTSPAIVALTELTKVWGIGSSTAKKVVNTFNVFSIDDLRRNEAARDSLNVNQKLGLEYFEDLEQRIPRSEIELIQSTVARALSKLGYVTKIESTGEVLQSTNLRGPTLSSSVVSHSVARNSSFDVATNNFIYTRGELQIVTCGSFRRGASSSGDVDILICDVKDKGQETVVVDFLREYFETVRSQKFGMRDENDLQFMRMKGGSRSMAPSSAMSLSSSLFSVARFDRNNNQGQSVASSSSSLMSSSHHQSHEDNQQQQYHKTNTDLPDMPAIFDLFERLISGESTIKKPTERHETQTWMGMVRLEKCKDPARCPCAHKSDGTHFVRRLDLKSYKREHFAFAKLYFTGSAYFNRSMRLHADRSGFRLSDKELLRVRRDTGRARDIVEIYENEKYPALEEKDVFDHLNLPYLEPCQRSYENTGGRVVVRNMGQQHRRQKQDDGKKNEYDPRA